MVRRVLPQSKVVVGQNLGLIEHPGTMDAILTKSFEWQRVIGTISVYNRMYTRLVAFSIPVLDRKNHKVAQDLPSCLLNDSDDISRKMASHVFPIQQPWQDQGHLYSSGENTLIQMVMTVTLPASFSRTAP